MSLLLKLGRGLQGFMGGSLVLGTKKLQQTLTSSGTYTANGLSTAYVVIGGGANGGNAPGNGNSNPGGSGGFIAVGTGTFNTPFPYTIGGVSGTTNFGPGVSASGAPNPAAAGGTWINTPTNADPGPGSATNASVTIAPSSNVPESAFTITVGGGGAGGRNNNFAFPEVNDPRGAGKAGGGNVPSPVAPVTGQSSGTQGGPGGNGFAQGNDFYRDSASGEAGKRGSGGGSGGAGTDSPRSGGSGGAGVIYVYYGDFV